MSQPIDKGRVSCVVGQYIDKQTGQPKNRYANIGRATLWPTEPGKTMPNVQIEIDTLPLGHVGELKMNIFWDSERDNQQPAPQAAPQQQYQQQRMRAQQQQQQAAAQQRHGYNRAMSACLTARGYTVN